MPATLNVCMVIGEGGLQSLDDIYQSEARLFVKVKCNRREAGEHLRRLFFVADAVLVNPH